MVGADHVKTMWKGRERERENWQRFVISAEWETFCYYMAEAKYVLTS